MPQSHNPEEGGRLNPPRSKSPERHSRHDAKRHHHTRRSRSPRRDEDRHRHKRHRSRSPVAKPVILPYKAKPLSRRQYEDYKPLFQSYLDIQKHIQLDELDEREAKGRWKSFISRWYVTFTPHGVELHWQVLILTLQESWRPSTQLVRSFHAQNSPRNCAIIPTTHFADADEACFTSIQAARRCIRSTRRRLRPCATDCGRTTNRSWSDSTKTRRLDPSQRNAR
jgi:hypothetical protein